MCMEDIRIGRATFGDYRGVTVSTTIAQLLGNAPKRTRITFFGPRNGLVSIAPNPAIVFGEGIVMSAGDRPVMIGIEDYGTLLTQAWFAITDVGSTTVDLWSGLLSKE